MYKFNIWIWLGIVSVSVISMSCHQAGAQQRSTEQQITAAVQALPQNMQEEATVKGYDPNGDLVTIREGSNGLICLADDPSDDRYHVACYQESLEPFMARGRELEREGKSRGEKQQIRKEEIESGTLSMPDGPAALYSLSGPADGFDYKRNKLRYAKALRVVYIPYATVESTGLPPSPIGAGAPWLMNPGTPWAHIMISAPEPLGYDAKNEGDSK
jgi:hypothetical protein